MLTVLDGPLLLVLLTAHLLADFPLQPDSWVARKRNPLVLIGHALVVGAVTYVLLGAWTEWRLPVAVLVAHLVIDTVKTLSGGRELRAFTIDQIAHAVSLIAAAALFPVRPAAAWWLDAFGPAVLPAFALISGVILATSFSGTLVGLVVQPFLTQLESTRSWDSGARGFRNGGRMIGHLERLLVFVAVTMGHPGAIGFLIAAKSILRFGEVKDRENRMEAEYIIIGTLLSFLLAVIASYLFVAVQNALAPLAGG